MSIQKFLAIGDTYIDLDERHYLLESTIIQGMAAGLGGDPYLVLIGSEFEAIDPRLEAVKLELLELVDAVLHVLIEKSSIKDLFREFIDLVKHGGQQKERKEVWIKLSWQLREINVSHESTKTNSQVVEQSGNTSAASEPIEYLPNKGEARLIDLLLTEGAMERIGIAERLECSEKTVERNARIPIQRGVIIRRAGRYSATEKARNLSL